MCLTPRQVLLCRRADLTGDLQRFDVDGHRVVVISVGDELIAIDDTCSHESASLAQEGEVDPETREVECCRHGARFSLDDGSATSLPATRGLRIHPLVADGEDIYIKVSS